MINATLFYIHFYLWTIPIHILPLFVRVVSTEKREFTSNHNSSSSSITAATINAGSNADRPNGISQTISGYITTIKRTLDFYLDISLLIWVLEKNRRYDELLILYGYGDLVGASLPHVDTKSSTSSLSLIQRLSSSISLMLSSSSNETKGMKKSMMGMQMKSNEPIVKRVVLIGGGHSHAYVLKSFAMKPMPGVEVILINDGYDTPYSGMLPGYVSGVYTRKECHIDLVKITQFAKIQFIRGRVKFVDRDLRLVHIESDPNERNPRPPICYDVLSIDIGSSPTLIPQREQKKKGSSLSFNGKESRTFVTPVKPIANFTRGFDSLVKKVLYNTFNLEKLTKIGIVGAGAGGIELALAIHHKLKSNGGLVEVSVFSHSDRICPSHHPKVADMLARILAERNIAVHLRCKIDFIEGNKLISSDGQEYEIDECFLCTDASAQPWLKESGFDVDEKGFIKVGADLESTNTRHVFGAGDCSHVAPYPRPKAGVFAVRQGPPLTENIRLALENKKLLPFEPQSRFLGIIGLGGAGYAIASRGDMVVGGEWIWKLKDWIDRKWMAGYTSHLSGRNEDDDVINAIDVDSFSKSNGSYENSKALSMLRQEMVSKSMRCGGCGSKVGSHILGEVMNDLRQMTNTNENQKKSGAHVIAGINDPDDCALIQIGDDKQNIQVQTVDFFRSFVSDPYLFGRIAANHALSDCHAMGADANTALAIAVVPFASDRIVADTLRQVMAGAINALNDADCSLVGGHTSEGTELSMGFAITGLLPRDKPALRKHGIMANDVLILTKPLGTGVIFAANMRSRANCEWVDSAIQSMLLSNRDAAFIARDTFNVTACTDVTGFGLIGHLVEMLKEHKGPDSDILEIHLNLNSIPLLPGAIECVSRGIFSSLSPSNMRLRRAISNATSETTQLPAYPLLFDPQTAGGLLFAIPQNQADPCIQMLREHGYNMASVIGKALKKHKPHTSEGSDNQIIDSFEIHVS